MDIKQKRTWPPWLHREMTTILDTLIKARTLLEEESLNDRATAAVLLRDCGVRCTDLGDKIDLIKNSEPLAEPMPTRRV